MDTTLEVLRHGWRRLAVVFTLIFLLLSGGYWASTSIVPTVLNPPTPPTGTGAGSGVIYKDLYPTSDITTEWTYTNVPHWSQVDEVYTSPNTADYVATMSSSYVNESWGLADYSPSPALPTDYVIFNVTLYEYATRTGSCNFYLQIKTESTFYSVSKSLNATAWTWMSNTWTTNPNTGLAWIWTQINAMEVGCRGKQTVGMPEVADCYVRIYYGYTAATPPVTQDFCYVDSFSNTYTSHTKTGTTPYLDMVDYGADSGNNYVNLTGSNNATTGLYYFANTAINASGNQPGEVRTYLEFRIYELGTTGHYYYFNVTGDGTTYQEFTYTCVGAKAGTWFWDSLDISALIDSLTKVNNTRLILKPKYGNQGTLFDCMRLNVTIPPTPLINSISCNTDYGGVNATFTVNASDTLELDFYMLSTNVSDSFVNGTWIAFAEDQTNAVGNAYAVTPATINKTSGYQFFVNNTSGRSSASNVAAIWITDVVLYPNGNGYVNQLQPAWNNYLMVDDPFDLPDDDVTRVYAPNTTTGNYTDFYEMGDLTLNTESEIDVEFYARIKSQINGYRAAFLPEYRLNGETIIITSETLPAATYANVSDSLGKSSWNQTEINSLQMGMQIRCGTDYSSNYTGYMTRFFIIVHPSIPIFKNGWINSTTAGHGAQVHMTVYHSNIGETLTFSTNNTGPWVNATVCVTTEGLSRADFNYTITLNSTVGVLVLWKWFYNTTANGMFTYQKDVYCGLDFMVKTQKPTLIERLTDLISVTAYDTSFDSAYFGTLVGATNKTTLQNMIANETSWVNVLRYSSFTEKYGINNETKIKWALNNATLQYYLPETSAGLFEVHSRGALYGFYYAAKYDYLTAKWNWTECYNTLHSACANISTGSFLWYNMPAKQAYSYSDRYYDENAETLSCFLILYEKCNVTAAMNDALTIWERLNAYYWYAPEQHYVYNAAAWNTTWSYECAAGAFLSIIAELRYLNSSIPYADRLQTDIQTRFVAQEWESPQWRYWLEDTAYFGVMHHSSLNPQRRLDATLQAWTAMLGLYPTLNATERANIAAMLSGYDIYPPAWELLFNPRLALYDPATSRFTVYSDEASNKTWEAVDLLFFLSMIPNATLAIPIEELDYMYQYGMADSDLFGLNISTRSMNVSVSSAGNITFLWNQTVSQHFDSSGTYNLTFAADWNSITSCTRLGDLPTNRKFLSGLYTSVTITADAWTNFYVDTLDVGHSLADLNTTLWLHDFNVTQIEKVNATGHYMFDWQLGYVNVEGPIYFADTEVEITMVWVWSETGGTWDHTYD